MHMYADHVFLFYLQSGRLEGWMNRLNTPQFNDQTYPAGKQREGNSGSNIKLTDILLLRRSRAPSFRTQVLALLGPSER